MKRLGEVFIAGNTADSKKEKYCMRLKSTHLFTSANEIESQKHLNATPHALLAHSPSHPVVGGASIA